MARRGRRRRLKFRLPDWTWDFILPRAAADPSVPSTGIDFPTTTGNRATLADAAGLRITGDFSGMIDLAMDDWTPAASAVLTGRYNPDTGGQRAFRFLILTNGRFLLQLSADGTNATASPGTSAAPVVTDGNFLAIGWSWRASDGRTQFWTAPSGTATHPGGAGWTQLSVDVTAAIGSIFAGTDPLTISDLQVGSPAHSAGIYKRVRLWASIDGTDERLDVNFVGVPVLGTRNPSSFSEDAANATVTISGSAWDWTV